MQKTNIYILKLEGGKYYVGKSNDPYKRFNEHLYGSGSAWTRQHKPIKIEKIIPSASSFDEDKYTKEYMSKYGIDNVRGGTYVETKLNPEQHASLQKEIWSANNKCTKCGRNSHFVADCFATTDIDGHPIIDEEYVYCCDVCDAEFETLDECEKHQKYCKKPSQSQKNNYSYSRNNNYSYNKSSQSAKNTCFRCGCEGHYAPDCYASKHISGKWIDSDSDSDY
jgi:cellular nucleic acid-binding protein